MALLFKDAEKKQPICRVAQGLLSLLRSKHPDTLYYSMVCYLQTQQEKSPETHPDSSQEISGLTCSH